MTNPFIFFLLSFCLVSSRHSVITVIFKMLHTFLLKWQSKHYTIIKLCHSNNSNGKDLTDLFKMGLLQTISKLILLKSLDEMVKLSKFMLPSQVSKWSEIAYHLTFLRRLSNVKFSYVQLPWCKNGVLFCHN